MLTEAQRKYQREWARNRRASGIPRQRNHAREHALRLARDPNYRAKQARKAWRRLHERPEARTKMLARAQTRDRIRRGIITRQPCERCGAVKAEAHHDDYAKPLQVRWLCRRCHKIEHARIEGKE